MSPCITAWQSFQDMLAISVRNTFLHFECSGMPSSEDAPKVQPRLMRANSAPAEPLGRRFRREGEQEEEQGEVAREVVAAVWQQPCTDRLNTFDPLEGSDHVEELRNICGLSAPSACRPFEEPWFVAEHTDVQEPCGEVPAWQAAGQYIEGASWAPPSYITPMCYIGHALEADAAPAAMYWNSMGAAGSASSGMAAFEARTDGSSSERCTISSGASPVRHGTDQVVLVRLASENAPWAPPARTTVMLQNLPNNYNRKMMLELLDAEGFAGMYDFLYLPIDFRTHAAVGYAFINMTTAEQASRLHRRLDGFCRWALPSSKRCSVGWSNPQQGFESNVQRYRNSPLMHEAVPDHYRPIIFSNGERVPFPPPTKKIKPPRQGTQRMLV
mmetsp:Transcript_51814/g.148564  ORF Transcript_51814/g.148564 Transcript_51814/m.148564 type:complete len:385 (+) Transcript_51814:77-1231(+)